MGARFIQANLNHSSAAQDLLVQTMNEWLIQVAIIAEPYRIPPRDNWVGDLTGTAAIVCLPTLGAPPLKPVKKGCGYVAARWGQLVVIGVYFSPNKGLAEFEALLADLGAFVGQTLPCAILVAGDFNAKSSAWGSSVTDVRGRALQDWVTITGLSIVNRGTQNTCVRQHGGSVVDITLASPAIQGLVAGWRVVTEAESLSDHLYIRFDVCPIQQTPAPPRDRSNGPKWSLKRLNEKLLRESSIVASWSPLPDVPMDINEEVHWFRKTMKQICDAAMPRAQSRPSRRQVYWWSTEIARLRSNCVVAKRAYIRHRRRRRSRDANTETQLYATYKETKKALQMAIRQAKNKARLELIETLDRDPWGRPYRMVMGTLRPWAPPVTQTLDPQALENIITRLFPYRAGFSPPFSVMASPNGQTALPEVPKITDAELNAAVERLRAKHTAPGPDGVPGRIWTVALGPLGNRLRRLFDACLITGQFPPPWKVGRLVLVQKQGRPADSPSAYRPLVLLDEVGKLFERVIVRRLLLHLSEAGPDLSEVQYGFRKGRSTVDAILRVKALAEAAVSQGKVLLAVSLDIANAFNTLPWECIKEGLRYHGVPRYLYHLISNYLEGRQIMYTSQDGSPHIRRMSCGVPQGSVLGPLLWNIAYDWVLRGAQLPGAAITCYADDTLVTARGSTTQDAIALASASVSLVAGRIRKLGLEVALSKTEAICFHGPRRAPPPDTYISVDGVNVIVRASLKYLGIVLDSRWKFEEHFRVLAPKAMKCAGALASLLPNLRGPNMRSRSLYMSVVRSMVLYGAPVWHEGKSSSCSAVIRKLHRVMALRAIRAYCTVSYEAACLLAGSVPWELDALSHAELYAWRTKRVVRGLGLIPRDMKRRKKHLYQQMIQKWQDSLASPKAGFRTIEAISPVFKEWISRRHGPLTFHLVQMLTGHGCFGEYLYRVARREPTPKCHHCASDMDSQRHTLEECPAWVAERSSLVAIIGEDISLPAMVRSMVESEGTWNAAITFCESVLSKKEEAERERERAADAPLMRRNRAARGPRM